MGDNSHPARSVRTPRSGVVLMVPGFPENEADSDCLPAVQNYVAALAAARPDLDVHVIAFQYPYARGDYRWKDATVHALAGANRTGWRRMPTWLRALGTFARLRRKVDVQVLHTFWLTECTRVGQWASKAFGVRQVASIGGQDAQRSNHYLPRLDLDRMVITAGSRFAADLFADHAGAEPHVVPLGLDTGHLGGIDPPPRRDIDVIGVGSLIPLKRYGEFLDVIAALRGEFPGLRACIVGAGPEHDELAGRIVREDLEANVVLIGHLPRDQVFRHMLRSRVFLHTSKYESQAYVFLEALFAGLDVVCYPVGYAPPIDRVHRCSRAGELIETCRALMREAAPPLRQPVPTTEDTVREFEAIYGI